MSTKIFLHGGASSRRTPKNEKFFKEIIESIPGRKVKILCVYFARPEHRWQESFFEDRLAFEDQGEDKDLYIEMVEKHDFLEKFIDADVVFINGGFRGFLKEALEDIPNLRSLIDNKIIVGISAGANMLSKYYYSQGGDEIREGIDLLSIKIFCHYEDNLTKELNMLQEYGEDLPLYKIPEEEFITFNI